MAPYITRSSRFQITCEHCSPDPGGQSVRSFSFAQVTAHNSTSPHAPKRTPSAPRTAGIRDKRSSSGLPKDGLGYAMARAAELVAAVLEGRNLTQASEAQAAAHAHWPPAVRGAVRDLAWSTLRACGVGDLLLEPFLRTPPPAIIRALLLVAVQRLQQRPEQEHTVVDQAVHASAELMPPLKGMVNAVLRNALRQREQWSARIAAHPAARHAHPQWWIARLQKDCPEHWEGVLAAGNTHPPMAVRVNERRIAAADAAALLTEKGISFRPLANGALLLDDALPVSELPGFAEGLLSVQDAGAQWAARLLDARDGERVLDACAAPGGKTAHILERARVDLLALELDALRTRPIYANLARLGLNASVQTADCTALADWWDGRPFDRILADVPCSASGVVRRHPDIKWLRRDDDIAAFAARQARILDHLWRTLARGGTMLYVTCSVFDEENAGQIAAFHTRHPDAERLPIGAAVDWQLLPGPEHDGFYFALLRKRI